MDLRPRIINGCWQLATDHRADPLAAEDSLADLRRLADRGLTTFDCADIYTGVEERLGELRRRWIADGGNPDALRIHTKYVPDLETLGALDRAMVEWILDRSRQRLGVECLDLVQFHWWDFDVDGWVDAARHLEALRVDGWVRHLGVTNFDVNHLEPILEAGVGIVSNQVQYSLLDRRPERRMVEFGRRHGIGLLTYGALAGGFLTDRWHGADDPGADVSNRSLTKYRLVIDEFGGWAAFQELLDGLGAVARKHGVSIANVAVRWVLDRPGVNAVILGASNARHLDDTLRTFDLTLDAEDHSRIDAVLAAHPGPDGDIYSMERVVGGRHAVIMKTGLNSVAGADRGPGSNGA